MPIGLNENDLKNELQMFGEKYPKLSNEELFIAWFLRAFVTEDDEMAVKALTGQSNDKGIDAIFIDEKWRIIFIVQGKYRQKIGEKNEGRNDVLEFASLAGLLTGEDQDFQNYSKSIDPNIEGRIKDIRKKIKAGYTLKLFYLTTGKCAEKLMNEAETRVKRESENASLKFLQGKQILILLSDYIDGVAPPVPDLELVTESSSYVKNHDMLNRYDQKTEIESWLFSMNGNEIGQIFEKTSVRLFARNVRGYLGDTDINKNMERTLKNEPEYFWYYNNGITIICDKAEKITRNGQTLLRVTNPQIINGQQTTRTLARVASDKNMGSVLVRVISVPRDKSGASKHFETLVNNIVSNTNWQNAIKPSDLMSNDTRQIELERHFRKLDFFYIRKRQSKTESQRELMGKHYFVIKKEEVAQAVAACELGSYVVRNKGKEALFDKLFYDRVFPHSIPNFYLNRYILMREVKWASKGYPERSYAIWVVIKFLWPHLKNLVSTNGNSSNFIKKWKECEGEREFLIPAVAIDCVFKTAIGFYKKNRGNGARAADISSFFMRNGLDEKFEKYWDGSSNHYRARFKKHWKRFESKVIGD